MKKILAGLAIGLLLLTCNIVQAASVTSAVGVTMNTFGDYSPTYGSEHMYDQSGIQQYDSGATDWDTYFSGNPVHTTYAPKKWFGERDSGITGTIDLDLGNNYNVDKIALWNEENIGITSFDAYISSDSSFQTKTFLGTFTPSQHGHDVSPAADIFSFSSVAGQYIRFDITGAEGNSYNTVGISEIAFSTGAQTPVPVPSAMILLGCGLMSLVGIGRKKLHK